MGTTREPYAYAGDNPLNATDPTGLAFWDLNPWQKLKQGADWVNRNIARPAAAYAQAAVLNVESVVSTAFYAPYWGAYQVNSHWSGAPAPIRGAMSAVQRGGLQLDKWFDRVQQCSGYPGASANDEEQKVSPIPSLILPDPSDNWAQKKFSESWWTTQGPGTDSSGKDHYAD